MRALFFVVPLFVGCGSDAATVSPYDGDYELVSIERGTCPGALTLAEIPAELRYFRLADIQLATGRLMASYACEAPGECSDVHNFYYSFGWVSGSWSTSVYSAVKPPCQLGYTLRKLGRLDADTLVIESRSHQQTDASVTAEACTFPLAKSRASTMPCIGREVWTARRLR